MKELLADVCPVCGEKVDQYNSMVYYKPIEAAFHVGCWEFSVHRFEKFPLIQYTAEEIRNAKID